MIKRIIALLICFCFISEQAGYAQVAGQFAVPAYLSHLSPVADRFRPVQLRSIEFDPATDNFRLLLDKGDLKDLTQGQAEESTRKLFEYFKIGLALPNSMFWVNLRPDSPDNIIDPYLEKTDLGKILLEADLQLKKDLARFTDPDTAEGRQYWNKLYEKAEQIYAGQDIEIPTFTRPWIVPGEIIIRESPAGAFIYKAALKVMLEQDHIKDSPFYNFDDPNVKKLNEYSSDLVRQLIIPKLTREVNSSKRYAELRQVYYSLVLAQWFKSRNKDNPLINQKDLNGLTSKIPWAKAAYFNAYKKSFSEGEYRKEETVQSAGGLNLRQYFSGGIQIAGGSSMVISAPSTEPPAMAGAFLDGGARRVSEASKRPKQSPVPLRDRENSWPWKGEREVDESKAHPRTLININTIPGLLKPGPVLDLGCGSGDLDVLLALEGHEVVGVDLSGKQIELSRAKREQCSVPKSKNSVFEKNGQSYNFLFYMYEPYRHFEGPGTILMKSDDQYSAQELKEAAQRLVFVPGNFNDPAVIIKIRRTFGEFENIVVPSSALYMTPLGLLDSAQSLLAAQGRLVVQIADIQSFDLDALVWRSDGRLESAWLTQSFSRVRQQKPDNHFVSFYDLAEAAGFTLAREFITVEDGAFYLVFDKTREFDREKINALYEGSLTVKEYKAFLNRMSWRRIAKVVHDALAPLSERLASEEDEFNERREADIKQAVRESKDPLEPFRVYRGMSVQLAQTRWLDSDSADGGKILEGGNAAQRDGGAGNSAAQNDETRGLSVKGFLKQAQKEIFTLKLPEGINIRDVEVRPVIENLKAVIFNSKDINGLVDRLTSKRTHEFLPEAASAAIKQKLVELRERGRAIKVLSGPASPEVQSPQEEYLLSRFKGAMDALSPEERTRVEEFLYYYGRMHEARTIRGNESEEHIVLKALQNGLPGITGSYLRRLIEQEYKDKSLYLIGPLIIEAMARPEKYPGFGIADMQRCIDAWLGFGATDHVANVAVAAINRHPSRMTEQDVRKWITACRRRKAYAHATEILIAAVKQGILAVTPNDVRQSEKDLYTKGLLAAVVAGQNIKGIGVDDIKTAMALHRDDGHSAASYEFRVAMAVIQNNTPGISPPDLSALLSRTGQHVIVDLPIALMDSNNSALTAADIDIGVRDYLGFRNEEAARLAVAAIEKGVPGVTPGMIRAWVGWLIDNENYVEAGQISAAAAAQHIRGFDANLVNSVIQDCLTQNRWDQFGYELLCTALEKRIPGIDPAWIHADIGNSIRHGQIRNAGTLAVTAAAAIPRNEKISSAITAGIELSDADRLFFILPHTLLMDKAMSIPAEQFKRVQKASSRFRDTFNRINSALARDRRFDADVFENTYMAIAFSLEMLLPGALDQVSGLLEKSRNPQVAIRLLNAKKEALLDRDMLEQLEALKKRLYKSKKVQASAFYALIDIANAYMQSRAQQFFAQEVQIVHDGESVEDVRKRLAVGLLAPLASFADIAIPEVSPQAHKNIDFEFMDRLKPALEYISKNEPQYLDMFRGVLRALLADRFWDFIENENQSDPVGKAIARHNSVVRKRMNAQRIDDQRWLGKNKSDRMAHREFMYALQSSKLEYDPVSDAREVVRYLEMALNLGLPRSAVQPLADCLRSWGITVTEKTGGKGVANYTIPKVQSKNKDVYALLADEKALNDIARQADALLLLEDIRNTDWRLESVTHLKERVSTLTDRLGQDEYRNQLKGLRYHFSLRPIARNPGRDLFLGDYTNCCLAMNSRSYPEAMVYRLIDEGLNVIEVMDQATGRTIALSWLYIDEAGNLVIQNMEINAEYERIKPLMYTIGDEMIAYVQEFSAHIKARGTLLGMPGHGKYFRDDDFMKTWGSEKVRFGREKIGGYLGRKPYLDSAGKPYAFRVPAQAQRDGGFEELVVSLHSSIPPPVKQERYPVDEYRRKPVWSNLLVEEGGIYRMKRFEPVSWLYVPESMEQLGEALSHLEEGALKSLTVWEKAAWIFKEYYKIHPFIDGNKRTAMRLAGAYLESRGFPTMRVMEYLRTVSDGLIEEKSFTPEMYEYYAALGSAIFDDDISRLASLFEAALQRPIPDYIILKVREYGATSGDVIAVKIKASDVSEEIAKHGREQVMAALESLAPGRIFIDYRHYVEKMLVDLRTLPEEAFVSKKTSRKDGGIAQKDVAGIDFRALPTSGQTAQPGARMPQLTQELESLANASKIRDLDKEWQQIEAQIRSSEMPYARMKEYVAVCVCRPDAGEHLEKTVQCIMNILRLEEEQALSAHDGLKDLLACIG